MKILHQTTRPKIWSKTNHDEYFGICEVETDIHLNAHKFKQKKLDVNEIAPPPHTGQISGKLSFIYPRAPMPFA